MLDKHRDAEAYDAKRIFYRKPQPQRLCVGEDYPRVRLVLPVVRGAIEFERIAGHRLDHVPKDYARQEPRRPVVDALAVLDRLALPPENLHAARQVGKVELYR